MAKTDEIPVVIETLGPTAQGFSFALEKFQGRVQLRALHRPDYGPIYADWLSMEMRSRIRSGKKQLLARAVGLNKHSDLSVLDATAGLGKDGFTLAALGARVTMVERQPLIHALLKDAHSRAIDNDSYCNIAARIKLLNDDASTVMQRGHWDIIYLDPMYTQLGKSALPQKEMQIFRDLTYGDADASSLFISASHALSKRIVVKRACKADWLNGVEPQVTQVGAQARFDIYLQDKRSD